jgi:hypothetical protein
VNVAPHGHFGDDADAAVGGDGFKPFVEGGGVHDLVRSLALRPVSEAMIRWAAINTITRRLARKGPATRQQWRTFDLTS